MNVHANGDDPTAPCAVGDVTRDLLGHPRGLTVLFATEAWERFSYFGNAALLVLYMVTYLLEPGRFEAVLGSREVKAALELLFGKLEPQPFASQLFGFYTGFAYFTPILGGLIADRLLGQRRTVIIGGVLMAIGHFMMAFEALFLFALLALILGIGAFKPNISTQVGALYAPGDRRRDRAYSIFYVGINIGAFAAPLVCGTLAVQFGFHYGFAAAGLGMLVSLVIYLCGARTLPADERPRAKAVVGEKRPLHAPERRAALASEASGQRGNFIVRAHSASEDARKRADDTRPEPGSSARAVLTLIGICALVTLFWAAYDQQGNTIVLWAENFTDRSIDLLIWQGKIPSPWFLALNPMMILLLTPFIVRLWARQGQHGTEPAPVSKMAFGCLCVALANVVMAAAAWTNVGKASPLWLVGYFVLATIGELYLAPVGLALISKMAPTRMLSMMMGVWFATTLPADILAGFLGGFWSRMAKPDFFLMIAVIPALAGAAMWAFQKLVVRNLSASRGPGA